MATRRARTHLAGAATAVRVAAAQDHGELRVRDQIVRAQQAVADAVAVLDELERLAGRRS